MAERMRGGVIPRELWTAALPRSGRTSTNTKRASWHEEWSWPRRQLHYSYRFCDSGLGMWLVDDGNRSGDRRRFGLDKARDRDEGFAGRRDVERGLLDDVDIDGRDSVEDAIVWRILQGE